MNTIDEVRSCVAGSVWLGCSWDSLRSSSWSSFSSSILTFLFSLFIIWVAMSSVVDFRFFRKAIGLLTRCTSSGASWMIWRWLDFYFSRGFKSVIKGIVIFISCCGSHIIGIVILSHIPLCFLSCRNLLSCWGTLAEVAKNTFTDAFCEDLVI